MRTQVHVRTVTIQGADISRVKYLEDTILSKMFVRAAAIFALLALALTSAAPARAQGEPATPDDEMQSVLDALASLNAPPLHTLAPPSARNVPGPPYWVATAAARAGIPAPQEQVGKVQHITIPGEGGDILLRVYTPKGDGPFPVVVYFHGGGWVIANLDAYDPSARALTNASGAIFVSVNYRQAPEMKYPAATNDAFSAYKWAIENAGDINGDPKQVAVAGESAGGNLATGVSLRARDEGVQMPIHQLLIYPITNYAFDTESYQTYADAVPLSKPLMQYFFRNYLPNEAAGDEQYVSPLRADSLEGLPPTTMVAAEIDPLTSEGKAYADRLSDSGVSVRYQLYEGLTHEFFGMGAVVSKAKDAVAFAAEGLRSSFNNPEMPNTGAGGLESRDSRSAGLPFAALGLALAVPVGLTLRRAARR